MKPKLRRTHPLEYNIVRILLIGNIWWQGCLLYKNPIRSFRAVVKLVTRFNKLFGRKKLVRAFKLDGKYVWDMFNPAWPSAGFNNFFRTHLIETDAITGSEQILRRLLIAITKRCPLQCEHCSEAATLYQQDVLSYEQFVDRIEPFVQNGVGQLVYSGGEPLSRFEDLLKLLTHFKSRCDQWIYSSGYGLTAEKAVLLKKAGLNGAAISLDHHLEDAHNKFRGNKNSYHWVIEAIKNLQNAGIMVAVNSCPTKKYIESGELEKLVELCKQLNVPFVNLLEPRAVGNYQDMDVELHQPHKNTLEELSKKYNFNKAYFNYPTVLYPASFRKNAPCGGGRSYLLLDYDGTLYPCPFCKVRISVPKQNLALCEAV